ncbi:MAG: protein kinase, partial [Chloroflexi bacterium]|nr:protein kinase [Chloroflexota bacterium]
MATDRLVGTDLARYHIEAVLGRGGMGVVYRAIDARLGRTVALKVLSGERAADPEFRERFIRESRLLASIEHPNIVPIFEADEADEVLYIAMRYIPGPELRQIIIDEAPMDPARTVGIVAQVADALDAAHAAGLVHRDVKPGNVLVMPGLTREAPGYAYLTDFGLTKATSSDTGLTKMGQFVGTPGYIAPEQIEGARVDHRADIYALGCILYNCLSGDVPYPRESTVASLWAHLKEPPPKLSEHRKGLPKGLDGVIVKALAKSPDQRFQTCGALAAAARDSLVPLRRVHRPAPRRIDPISLAPVHPVPIAAAAPTVVTPTAAEAMAGPAAENKVLAPATARIEPPVEPVAAATVVDADAVGPVAEPANVAGLLSSVDAPPPVTLTEAPAPPASTI